MKKVSEYLNEAKKVTGSDYRTAKVINVTRSAISNCRKTEKIDVNNAVNLAKIIGINPAEIIAASNIALYPENAGIWSKWVATFCLTTSALSLSIQEVTAEVSRIVCILCSIDNLSLVYEDTRRT